MGSFLDELSPHIKTYKITIKKNGVQSQWRAKGIKMKEAEDSIQAFVGGDITFLGCKDITDEIME